MAIGDTFISGDYLCTIWSESSVHIQANDKTKVSYATPPRQVTHGGRTYRTELSGGLYGDTLDLPGCFEGCKNLKIGPDIPTRSELIADDLIRVFKGCTSLTSVGSLPTNLDYMIYTFEGCSSLVTAPVIPNSVTNMLSCFEGCSSLVTAPVIPNSVTNMLSCFKDCTSLSGAVVINTNTVTASYLFAGTQKGIWLTGSSSRLQVYADTATNGNVFVGEIPLSGSLTAERVGSDGGTTPEAEGNWLHLILSISWSKFSSNSLSSITIYDNNILNPVTWYTDASKTSAIILPDWRPDPTVEVHAWLYIDKDTHTIQVNIADAYHTGKPVVITVPQVFRTIDFLRGGKGIAFGKVAEHEGFDCAMDVFIRPWAGFIQLFAGSTPPAGWLPCDGSEVAVADYPRLYSVIGNTYGAPSDSDHFLLPDLKDRFPVGAGAAYDLNDKGGQTTVTLNVNQIPSHGHAINGTYYKRGTGSYETYGYVNKNGDHTGYSADTGGGQAHENRPPYIGINFIIYTGEPS